jgi:hypothetical protein
LAVATAAAVWAGRKGAREEEKVAEERLGARVGTTGQ